MSRRLRSGVLLAGGTSARFGSPKGLAPFAGARLCDRPLAALREACDEVLVAANDPRAEGWFPGLRVVGDVHAFNGGLSALATACSVAAHDTVVVCAWDMPFVTATLLDALATPVDDGAPCCVPVHASGAIEPLCAAYDKRAAMQVMTTLLAADADRSAQRLAHLLRGRAWRIDEQPDGDDIAHLFLNVNTTDDLAQAALWLDTHHIPTPP